MYPSQQFSEFSEIFARGTHFISWCWPNMSDLSKIIYFHPLSEFEHNVGYSPPRKLISRALDALGNFTLALCSYRSYFSSVSTNKVVLSAVGASKYGNNSCKYAAIWDHFQNYFWASGKDISTTSANFCFMFALVDAACLRAPNAHPTLLIWFCLTGDMRVSRRQWMLRQNTTL